MGHKVAVAFGRPGPPEVHYSATLVPHELKYPLIGTRWDALVLNPTEGVENQVRSGGDDPQPPPACCGRHRVHLAKSLLQRAATFVTE